MRKVAFLGCGAINTIVAEYVTKEGFAEIIGAYDIYPEAIDKLKEKIQNPNIQAVTNIEELIALKPDVIVEAASPDAAAKYDPRILENGIDVVSLDTGIMSQQYDQLTEITKRVGSKIYFPSGAIGGIDMILSMAQEGIDELTITTTKKPQNLQGYNHLTKKTEIFNGFASEAIKKFPKNVNVAVTLSFAANKEAKVIIVADPNIQHNQHEINAKSQHVDFYTRVSNIPSSDNPKTSYSAALSAVQILKQAVGYQQTVKVGN